MRRLELAWEAQRASFEQVANLYKPEGMLNHLAKPVAMWIRKHPHGTLQDPYEALLHPPMRRC